MESLKEASFMFCERPMQCFFSDTLVALRRVHDLRELPPLDLAKKTVVTGRRVTVVAKIGRQTVSALERARSLFSIPPIFPSLFLSFKSPVLKRVLVPL